MGSKASTPASPVSDDSSPTRQIYSRAERVSDYEQSARQARNERSFMERAESSIHNFIYSNNTSSVDIQRSSHTNGEHVGSAHDRLGSSLEVQVQQPARPSSIPTGSSRSYSIGSTTGVAAGQSDSTSSSISSNTGLSHFLSSFNLWRASGPSTSDRQRAQSLSHMPDPALLNQSSTTNQSGDSSRSRYETEEPSSLSNPRAALTRLLSSRETRTSSAGNNPSSTNAEGSGHHQRRDNTGPFSVRDLTFAAAQEFLAEATLNGLGLGRVYVTHSLPSHMWAVNGNHISYSCMFSSLDSLCISRREQTSFDLVGTIRYAVGGLFGNPNISRARNGACVVHECPHFYSAIVPQLRSSRGIHSLIVV